MTPKEESDELLEIAYNIELEYPQITAVDLFDYMLENEVRDPYEALRYLITN